MICQGKAVLAVYLKSADELTLPILRSKQIKNELVAKRI
jgi:hypothetical protein